MSILILLRSVLQLTLRYDETAREEGLNTASMGRSAPAEVFSRILCNTITWKRREDGVGVCTDGASPLAHFEREQHISRI